MSLIICSECGKEYSDRANACPNCACPNPLAESLKSFAGETATKPKRTLRPIITTIIILALLTVVIGYVRNIYLYNSGLDAMYVGDYSTARNCLEGLNHDNINLIMNDISFLEDLEEIVKEEIAHDSEIEYIVSVAESNLDKLRKYKVTEFYTNDLDQMVERYIEGLQTMVDALNIEDVVAAEYDMLVGQYYCDYVVVVLHDSLGFMKNSSKYEQVYTDILAKEEAVLTAFQELHEKGHIATKVGDFKFDIVTLYLKIDNKYKFDQTYQFDFYEYEGDEFLESVTVDILGIEPYSEYTVSIDVPQSARNGYTVDSSYYYLDIVIPD